MMKYTLLSATFLFVSILAAQVPKNYSCSNAKRHLHNQAKSASLSVAQIAETERYDVHYYKLDVAMDNLSTDISGTVDILASAREQLDSALFELHSALNISEIRVDGTAIAFSRNNSAVKVPVNAITGQAFTISVDYGGTPPTFGTTPFGGAGMSNESSPSWGNQVTWSLSEPFSAYEWFPCKQSLKDKADSSDVWITVPNSCKAGSNGILENVTDMGNGTSRYEWKSRHPIDYYLISVSVAEYVEYNTYANPTGAPAPVLIQNFIYDNPLTLNYFQNDIDETADFIELFSDFYSLYPFHDEKYGHCMAPLSGGMEHQTMTTLGFFDNTLTAHELAHQWWGDYVTCASWTDIWVNEGFASYNEYLMLENLYPGQQVADMNDRHQNIMSQTGGSVWVIDSLDENAIFSGRLVYDKGAALVHTLRFAVNDDQLFFQGLRDYLDTFADSVAMGTDVQHALESASGINLSNYFDEWYYGEGYPTYSARWNTLGNDLVLEISQTASQANVTPFFTNDLEVRFQRNGLPDTTIRLSIDAPVNQFLVSGMGNATVLNAIDPNNWIINKVASIQKDETFVSVEEVTAELPVSIFPNPSEGLVTIRVPGHEQLTATIYGLDGKVRGEFMFLQQTTIDLTGFGSGSYILELKDAAGKTAIRRLIRL